MYKKVVAVLLAGSMVMTSAVAVMAGETEAEAVATVGDDAEVKEALEEKVGDVTDEDGSFDESKLVELMASLFGPEDGEELPEIGKEIEEGIAAIKQIDEAIDQHLAEEFADSLEEGDETICSHTIADVAFPDEDGVVRMLGYFSLTNYDVDEDCPDDLVMKNFAGQPELLTLAPDEDGVYAVTDCMAAEDGEGYADSVAAMCEEMGMDLDKFYEAMALTDLTYLVDLYNFMDEHEQYDHIEYMAEMKTADELGDAIGDEFAAYLKLYALDSLLGDAAETEAESDEDDFGSLVKTLLTEIEEAAADVDLEKKKAETGEEFSESGTVLTLIADILADVNEKTEEAGMEENESVEQALAALSSLGETDEEELDGLLDVVLLGLLSGEVDEEPDEEETPDDYEIANIIVDFVVETVKDNELIQEAVEATDSKLFDMISSDSDDDETDDMIEDISEEPFEEFEEELAKVTDYINEQDGPKQAALDMLDLLHSVVDEVHYAVHGHTSEDME